MEGVHLHVRLKHCSPSRGELRQELMYCHGDAVPSVLAGLMVSGCRILEFQASGFRVQG